MRDPLTLLAIAVGVALLFVVISPSWTHQPADNNTLTILGTMGAADGRGRPDRGGFLL
ncbi:hypothetical protein [uncultured Deinococcus sp.]|uniref:hypothetical protein n=1 Tax=uncultured Deinococcus sp. TaxID=158789 RepID=UPI002589C05D|nr:hypothetical protein [uncultured Deinococcus sp.]